MKSGLIVKLAPAALLCCLCVVPAATQDAARQSTAAQSTPPQDAGMQSATANDPAYASSIFVRDEAGARRRLPFEAGSTQLVIDRPAPRDQVGYIELPGAASALKLAERQPRFDVGFRNAPDGRPPFLVRLGARKSARRFTAITERGRTGFARLNSEVVPVAYRTLGEDGGVVRLEAVPRSPLAPGEYAFVDTDSRRIATFGIE